MADDAPTLEEMRRRLEFAMDTGPRDDWFEEAERRLYADQNKRANKRMYDVSTVGARIRTGREIVGLTQKQLASRLGVHPWWVSNWERGTRDLHAAKLQGLCLIIACSQAWLLGESEEGGPPVPLRQLRKPHRPGWAHESNLTKQRARAKAELDRLRGLRPPKVPREG